jgi:hypothetical protein
MVGKIAENQEEKKGTGFFSQYVISFLEQL